MRGNVFKKYILLGDKKNNSAEVFFEIYSRGIETGHDLFSYNFSVEELRKNIKKFAEEKNLQFDEKKLLNRITDHFAKNFFISISIKDRDKFQKFFPTATKKIF